MENVTKNINKDATWLIGHLRGKTELRGQGWICIHEKSIINSLLIILLPLVSLIHNILVGYFYFFFSLLTKEKPN